MSAGENRTKELRQTRSVLGEMGGIVEEACLTGAFGDAGRILLRQCNAIITHPKEHYGLLAFLFSILPEESTLQEIGVMAKLLSGYLAEGTAPSEGPDSIRPLIVDAPEHIRIKLEDVKKVGLLVREQMAAHAKEEIIRETAGQSERQARLAGIAAEIRAVAESLAAPGLSDEERADLAERLTRLSEEQDSLFQ